MTDRHIKASLRKRPHQYWGDERGKQVKWLLLGQPSVAKFLAIWKGRGRRQAAEIAKITDEYVVIGRFTTLAAANRAKEVAIYL